jgi:5-hydroxyisourate hydrolase
MGRLTTHVLDAAAGTPAAGLKIDLYHRDGAYQLIKSVVTNHDGRVDHPLLEGDKLRRGQYELQFHAGDYLKSKGHSLSDPPFLDLIPIRFGVGDPGQHYHVPLLLAPYSFSTYRGS